MDTMDRISKINEINENSENSENSEVVEVHEKGIITPENTENANEGKQSIWTRFRSWALWLSVGALVVFCVKEFAGVDISETVDGLLNVLLPVLVAFGIVNNPTDKSNF